MKVKQALKLMKAYENKGSLGSFIFVLPDGTGIAYKNLAIYAPKSVTLPAKSIGLVTELEDCDKEQSLWQALEQVLYEANEQAYAETAAQAITEPANYMSATRRTKGLQGLLEIAQPATVDSGQSAARGRVYVDNDKGTLVAAHPHRVSVTQIVAKTELASGGPNLDAWRKFTQRRDYVIEYAAMLYAYKSLKLWAKVSALVSTQHDGETPDYAGYVFEAYKTTCEVRYNTHAASSYVAFRRVTETAKDHEFLVSKAELLKALRSVKEQAGGMYAEHINKAIRLHPSARGLQLVYTDPYKDFSCNAQVPVQRISHDVLPYIVAVNGDFLQHALKYLRGDAIIIGTDSASKPVRISNGLGSSVTIAPVFVEPD